MLTAALVAAAAVAGYWTGRVGLGGRLDDWAHRAASRGRRTVAWWPAQVVFAIELAYAWGVHPLRTRANVRSWREAREASARSRNEPVEVVDLTQRTGEAS